MLESAGLPGATVSMSLLLVLFLCMKLAGGWAWLGDHYWNPASPVSVSAAWLVIIPVLFCMALVCSGLWHVVQAPALWSVQLLCAGMRAARESHWKH